MCLVFYISIINSSLILQKNCETLNMVKHIRQLNFSTETSLLELLVFFSNLDWGSRALCVATILSLPPASSQCILFVYLGASLLCWLSYFLDTTFLLFCFTPLLLTSNQVYKFQSLPAPLPLAESGVSDPWDFLGFWCIKQLASLRWALIRTCREKKLKSKLFTSCSFVSFLPKFSGNLLFHSSHFCVPTLYKPLHYNFSKVFERKQRWAGNPSDLF